MLAGWAGTVQAGGHNPILDRPDPFITYHLVDGKRLLLATTGSNITIWYGPSIVSSANNSKIVYTPADGMIDLMSPTIWNIEGHWWIYFAGRYRSTPQGIYALRADSDDPLGSYSFRGNVKLEHPSIDPSLLLLDDKIFLMTASVDGGENAVRMVQLVHPMQPDHAKASDAVTMAGRSIRAQTFTWNADGTPNLGLPRSDTDTNTPLERE